MTKAQYSADCGTQSIFIVTTLKPPHDTRTVAWFRGLATAKRCIRENWCDIHEGDYTYAIIEEAAEGLYPVPAVNEYWYRWVDGTYIEVPKPRNQKNTSGFGIG